MAGMREANAAPGRSGHPRSCSARRLNYCATAVAAAQANNNAASRATSSHVDGARVKRQRQISERERFGHPAYAEEDILQVFESARAFVKAPIICSVVESAARRAAQRPGTRFDRQ